MIPARWCSPWTCPGPPAAVSSVSWWYRWCVGLRCHSGAPAGHLAKFRQKSLLSVGVTGNWDDLLLGWILTALSSLLSLLLFSSQVAPSTPTSYSSLLVKLLMAMLALLSSAPWASIISLAHSFTPAISALAQPSSWLLRTSHLQSPACSSICLMVLLPLFLSSPLHPLSNPLPVSAALPGGTLQELMYLFFWAAKHLLLHKHTFFNILSFFILAILAFLAPQPPTETPPVENVNILLYPRDPTHNHFQPL